MKLGAVLMASGSGQRFGGNKLLVPVDGIPLIQRAMGALPAGAFSRAVVCSPYREILALAAERGYLPLPNACAQEGVSASIRLGLSALEDMDGVLFAVCDQPFLTAGSVLRLIHAFEASPASICALSWQGRRGNPVIFPAALFPALSSLSGDTGGSAVIRAHPALLHLVEAGSPMELRDIDTPACIPPVEKAHCKTDASLL